MVIELRVLRDDRLASELLAKPAEHYFPIEVASPSVRERKILRLPLLALFPRDADRNGFVAFPPSKAFRLRVENDRVELTEIWGRLRFPVDRPALFLLRWRVSPS